MDVTMVQKSLISPCIDLISLVTRSTRHISRAGRKKVVPGGEQEEE